jgi:hypothetical protein
MTPVISNVLHEPAATNVDTLRTRCNDVRARGWLPICGLPVCCDLLADGWKVTDSLTVRLFRTTEPVQIFRLCGIGTATER